MVDFEEKAMDIQEKFELYLVSLTFTLLCLSVETASFGTYPIGDAFELSGWMLLLFSGISGLLRISYIPVVLRYYATRAKGLEIDESDLKITEDRISSRKYLWYFVSGLVFIIVARSASPLSYAYEFLLTIK